jgi:AraC-like DNA-binding protein
MAYVRKVEPTAVEWTGFSWNMGSFDTAHRSYTEVIEGTICTSTISCSSRWRRCAVPRGHERLRASIHRYRVVRQIRISDLAELVGLSCGHLHRAFRATTGKTPLAFINERRIEQAMAMLAQDHASVAEVSLRCGFLSPSHFARLFRRSTGVSPPHIEPLHPGDVR